MSRPPGRITRSASADRVERRVVRVDVAGEDDVDRAVAQREAPGLAVDDADVRLVRVGGAALGLGAAAIGSDSMP